MRINKPIVNYKDWKTKVIIGYVLIIALFCVATTWILFVTVPQAMEEMNRSESSVASQVEKDATANAESALQGEDAEQLSASANSVVGGGTYTVQAEDMARDQGNSLASIQVFGFGLLLAVLLIAALLSYWSYSAALNSVERTEPCARELYGKFEPRDENSGRKHKVAFGIDRYRCEPWASGLCEGICPSY